MLHRAGRMPAKLAPPTRDDRLGSADAPGRSPTTIIAVPGAALAHVVVLALVAWSVVPHGEPVRIGSISMVLTPRPAATSGAGPSSGLLAVPAAPLPPAALPLPMLPPPPIVAAPAAPRLPPLVHDRAAPRPARSRPGGSSAASARARPGEDGGLPAGAGAAVGPSGAMPASTSGGTQAAAGGGLALGGLETAIDRAIHDAAIMPEAARRQHREGRVLARFSYLDGVVHDPAIVQSSRSQLLDDAALLAVRQARCPAAPAGLTGRRLDLVVWIDFRISPS